MKIRMTLDVDVGDAPVADAITYLIGCHGFAPGNDEHTPEEWVETVLLTAIQPVTEGSARSQMPGWRVVSSHIERATS